MEAGLAIMGGLPILVAAEDGMSEAVFEAPAWGQGVSGVSLHVWDRPEPLADPALQGWLSSVRSSRCTESTLSSSVCSRSRRSSSLRTL